MLDAVPDQAGPEFGEEIGGVAAGEHVEHRFERWPGQLGVRCGPPHHPVKLLDRPGAVGDGRHDLLSEHVQRAGGDLCLFDRPPVHAVDDHGRLQEVAPIFGDHLGTAGCTDLMAGATDSLKAAGHRRRGLDLYHQVDRAHIDSELEG